MPVVSKENIEAKNGRDLLTTIDVDMQDIVESELRKQILDKNATCGTAVIMEVKTGEIRAISNLTRYGSTVRDDENHAVTMRCEPGSTFNWFRSWHSSTRRAMGSTTRWTVPRTAATTIRWADANTLSRTPTPSARPTCWASWNTSSNIGFVKVIDEEYHDSPERFVDFIHSLGIDRQVNMQLNGGLKPIIKDPRRKKETAWDALSLMKMSYGYAVEVTPIHTLMLYNAVANDGHMVAPRLVTAVMENGHAVERFGTETVNRKICSDKTLRLVRQALEGVVEEGTGSMMKNPNFKIAGKTGTAQIAMKNRGYADERGGRDYLATFVGYFPADNPRYSLASSPSRPTTAQAPATPTTAHRSPHRHSKPSSNGYMPWMPSGMHP